MDLRRRRDRLEQIVKKYPVEALPPAQPPEVAKDCVAMPREAARCARSLAAGLRRLHRRLSVKWWADAEVCDEGGRCGARIRTSERRRARRWSRRARLAASRLARGSPNRARSWVRRRRSRCRRGGGGGASASGGTGAGSSAWWPFWPWRPRSRDGPRRAPSWRSECESVSLHETKPLHGRSRSPISEPTSSDVIITPNLNRSRPWRHSSGCW